METSKQTVMPAEITETITAHITSGYDKFPVLLPGEIETLLGNQKFKVLCPNEQLKS